MTPLIMRVNRTPPHGLSPARGRMHLYSMIYIPFKVKLMLAFRNRQSREP